jgi:hypothetical protein
METGESEMNKNMWIKRMAAGAVLAAAPALIALGTATAANAEAGSGTNNTTNNTTSSSSYAPPQMGPLNGQYPWNQGMPWNQSSFHHRHAAQTQSYY